MADFRTIIDAFGYRSLARSLGCPEGTVSAWKTRNSIPQIYWREIEKEARRRRLYNITYRALEGASRPARVRRQVIAPIEAHR